MGSRVSGAVSAVSDVAAKRAILSLGLEIDRLSGDLSALRRNNVNLTSYALQGLVLTAGAGLTGGGDLSADRSFSVGAGTGITVGADSVSISSSFLGANPTASVGLSAVNGTATTYMRSDAAPALSVGIVPTWTGIHTFSAQDVHNAGVDLGTSGRVNSNVANAAAAVGVLIKPAVAYTSGIDRYVCQIQDSAGTFLWSIAADGSIGSQIAAHTGVALLEIGNQSVTLPSTAMTYGINFGPKWGATAGGTLAGLANATAAALFAATDNASATATSLVGGVFTTATAAARAHSNWIGGIFQPYAVGPGGTSATAQGNLYGWYVKGVPAFAKSSTATAAYGGYVEDILASTTPVTTDQYGIFIAQQTRGTNKYGLWLGGTAAGYKAISIGSTTNYIASESSTAFSLNTTTLTLNATNLGFYGVAAVARPSAYTQTYATATKTHANLTSAAVATTAATNIAPYGYTTQAQADDIITQLNALLADVTNLKGVVNSIIDDDQAMGLKQ